MIARIEPACRPGTIRGEIPCVSVPDTSRNAEREIVSARLRENRARRGLLEEKTEEIRAELRHLLVRGSNVALDVAEMARQAGISRDTAHRYLREAGQLSWRQRNATRKEENDG
jgi:Fic family protein